MLGIIGEKLGMTQIFGKDGSLVPVTVVRVSPNVVIGTRTNDQNGYNAIQLASGEQKESRVNKPVRGVYKKNKQLVHGHMKEFRTERSSEYQVGMRLTTEALVLGDRVHIQGVSKGKGFQGVMKRHHFSGGRDSHGVSVSHRVPGSIGQRTDPGHVIKGKKLPGHMGNETVTIKNLEIMGIESEQHIVLLKGAVPGSKFSRLYLYPKSSEFESKVLSTQQSAGSKAENGDQKEQVVQEAAQKE